MHEKSELEHIIEAGISGTPELKREEKNHYLGQFKERVIRYLTFNQVAEKGTYKEIKEAIHHPQAKKLILNQKIKISDAKEYINLARKNGLNFSIVSSPDFKGEIGLVVVSDDAVDVDVIDV